MKAKEQKPEYEDFQVQVSTCEGCPVMSTITAEDQRSWVEGGYGTVAELIAIEENSYRDWQSDC